MWIPQTSALVLAISTLALSADYCSNTYDDWFQGNDQIDVGFINSVELGSIVNPNSGGIHQPDYTFFDQMNDSLEQGQSDFIRLTISTFGHSVAAWIDFNADGIFDKAEKLGQDAEFLLDGERSHTWDFTVPEDAVIGSTRLRVRFAEYDDPVTFEPLVEVDPCATYNSGETEDYSITITEREIITASSEIMNPQKVIHNRNSISFQNSEISNWEWITVQGQLISKGHFSTIQKSQTIQKPKYSSKSSLILEVQNTDNELKAYQIKN
jgi:hypothetical protein